MKKIKYVLKRITRKIIKVFLHFLVLIVYRPKKIGEENIPKEGKYILCANHVHALDAVALVLSLKREVIFIAKEELFKNPIFRFLGNTFDVIAIKRGTGDIEAMKLSFKALKQGKLLGLFPEGTRNGMKKGKPLHNGAALIALKTNTKIIPIGIQGNFKPFKKIKFNIGKPMDFSKYIDKQKDKKILDSITKEVMDEVVRLTNERK